MGWNEYARSKIPLKLVFITLAAITVNLLIIGAFQMVTIYRYISPIDSETLGRMNSSYENSTILDSSEFSTKAYSLWGKDCFAYLLETEDGETKLAVVEKHPFFDRYRYMKKLSMDVPQAAGDQHVDGGTVYQTAWATIGDNSRITGFSISRSNGPSISLILIPMMIVEYVAYCLLFKRDELL